MSGQDGLVKLFDMTEQDISFVAALERELFSHPWDVDVWRDFWERDSVFCLMASFEGEAAGYCGVSVSYETGDLCRIAVAPRFRRKGIARALLAEMIRRCGERQMESILLEVRRHNDGAISLYRGQGFREIHVRKDYYRDPVEDAVVMQLSLPCFQ